jgi:hypothetical protein
MGNFRWHARATKAAELVAEGSLTYPAIAAEVGVARQTVWEWRQHPEFRARVAEHQAEIREEVRRLGVASRENRVRAYNARWERMRRIIEERAADPAMQGVPGGTTGLLVRTVKRIGTGDQARDVEEFTVDTGLLRELRDLEKQAAQDLGQWAEKSEVAASVDPSPILEHFKASLERAYGDNPRPLPPRPLGLKGLAT